MYPRFQHPPGACYDFRVGYTVILELERDGGYVAMVPALPGCMTQGDNYEEALRNIREAMELYIEDCVAVGDIL
jgi:predicted RNase H-like HicB family nuclease